MAALMTCFIMVGCGGGSSEATSEAASVEGTTWKVYKIVDGDNEMTGDDIAAYGEIVYAFKADGVVDVESNGATETGTYTQDGSSIVVNVNSEKDMDLVDGELILTYGGLDFVFEKAS